MSLILDSWYYYNNDSLLSYTYGSQTQLNARLAWVIFEKQSYQNTYWIAKGWDTAVCILYKPPGTTVGTEKKYYHPILSISQKQQVQNTTNYIEIIAPIRTLLKSILSNASNLEYYHAHVIYSWIELPT